VDLTGMPTREPSAPPTDTDRRPAMSNTKWT